MSMQVPKERWWCGSWRARRVTRRLIARLGEDSDGSSLRELVAVASRPRGKAAPLAHAALEEACEADPAIVAELIGAWVSGWFSTAGRRYVIGHLLASVPAGHHGPKPRVVAFLDETRNLRTGGDGHDVRVAERACRALAQELSERRRWSRELAVVFASTDHPGLLEALVQCWLEKRYSDSGDVLLEAIRRNPNLPRSTGENPAVAIIRNRLDLLDVTEWQTVDVMLDCIEDRSLPGLGEECRRLLLRLPPGAARDYLCRRARRSPAGRAVMREAGWLPSDTEERLLFFFLKRDLRSYAGMDPDGRLLRIAYRRSDPLTQSTIRQLVRELDTARIQPACAGSAGSEDAGRPGTAVPTEDAERDWAGFVTFDLGDFSADVGCGAARAFAAPGRRTRPRTRTGPGRGGRKRRGGRGFVTDGGCGSDSAGEQVRKYGCGHEESGCGGGCGGL